MSETIANVVTLFHAVFRYFFLDPSLLYLTYLPSSFFHCPFFSPLFSVLRFSVSAFIHSFCIPLTAFPLSRFSFFVLFFPVFNLVKPSAKYARLPRFIIDACCPYGEFLSSITLTDEYPLYSYTVLTDLS